MGLCRAEMRACLRLGACCLLREEEVVVSEGSGSGEALSLITMTDDSDSSASDPLSFPVKSITSVVLEGCIEVMSGWAGGDVAQEGLSTDISSCLTELSSLIIGTVL